MYIPHAKCLRQAVQHAIGVGEQIELQAQYQGEWAAQYP
jgi:hypothetical protein